MSPVFEQLLAAASRAPSGDNTQPWRFAVDEASGTIDLGVDPARDPSPMNAGLRMSRIAVGAALENLLGAARRLGLDAHLDAGRGGHLARVVVRGGPPDGARLDGDFGARVTNRRPYDGRPVPLEVLAALAGATGEPGATSTHWVVGPDRLEALGRVIGRADGVMFGEPAMRSAFLKNVRFDRPPAEAVDEGLSLGSLELSAADRLALRVMRRTPDPLLRLGGASSVFTAKACQLIRSSSGVLVVAASDRQESTDVLVGRAVQRAWLALTESGLSAQPMMSIAVLDNVLEHGDGRLRAAIGAARVSVLLDEFHALVPEIGDRRPAWVMRFGYALPPSGRTGRLPLDSVTADGPGGP